MNDTEILLDDLQRGNAQCSFDFEADIRFARRLGLDHIADVLEVCLASNAPLPVVLSRIDAMKEVQYIKQRRLRALRKLVQGGKVEAFWIGSGECGRADFNIVRIRDYRLVEGTK